MDAHCSPTSWIFVDITSLSIVLIWWNYELNTDDKSGDNKIKYSQNCLVVCFFFVLSNENNYHPFLLRRMSTKQEKWDMYGKKELKVRKLPSK